MFRLASPIRNPYDLPPMFTAAVLEKPSRICIRGNLGGSRKLLHGSILTAQGQPVDEATVELRDLRGIKVASGVTDSAGSFEISGAANPGEYVFLAAKTFQIRDERIVLDQPNVEITLGLPPCLPEHGVPAIALHRFCDAARCPSEGVGTFGGGT